MQAGQSVVISSPAIYNVIWKERGCYSFSVTKRIRCGV